MNEAPRISFLTPAALYPARQAAAEMAYFGVPVLSLTPEELLHCAVEGWKSYWREVDGHRASIGFYNALRGRSHG